MERTELEITGPKDRRGRTLLNWMDKCVDYARESSSRGAGFIYATLGVLTQSAHNFYTFYELSSYSDEYAKGIQAAVGAIFMSFALLYFVLISDGTSKRHNVIVNTFFIFEIFVNLFYWGNHIIFQPIYVGKLEWSLATIATLHWTHLIIAVPFSFFIPFIIKSYANEIRAAIPAIALSKEDFVKEHDIDTLRQDVENIKALTANDELSALSMKKDSMLNEEFSATMKKNSILIEELRAINDTQKDIIEKHEELTAALNTLLKATNDLPKRATETAAFIDREEVKEIVKTYLKEVKINSISEEQLNDITAKSVNDAISKVFGEPKHVKSLIESIPQIQEDYRKTIKRGDKIDLVRSDKDGGNKLPITLQ